MERLFQEILQMSLYGSVAILVVLILRKCFNNLPKRVTCLFWLIPGLRLLCPVNIGSVFSIMNIAKLSGKAVGTDVTTNAVSGVRDAAVTPALIRERESVHLTVGAASRVLPDIRTIAAYIWLVGMIAIILYLAVKTIRLNKMLKGAKRIKGSDCYRTDIVDTSFVLGVIRPNIYIQSGLSEIEESYILMHERIHLRYRDHITRIVGVLTLCIHWFNPIVWVAFTKMCADLEMRCDEAVIDRMGNWIKKDYCRSIVSHALERETVQRGLYTAFAGDNHGEREVKMRIKNLIGYRKVSKIVTLAVSVFALGLTIVVSAKAKTSRDNAEPVTREMITITDDEERKVTEVSEEEHVGAPVSVPGNILLDMTEEECLENYGKEDLPLPADVEYSDEGRPYSKTYDYRDTPQLKALAEVLEKDGFTEFDPDVEYLDKQGNVKVGRELYVYNAEKVNGDKEMGLNAYMVSDEYARDSFDEKNEKDGIWWTNIGGAEDGWYIIRIYDTVTGIMIDASGTYEWDWQSLDLFGRNR